MIKIKPRIIETDEGIQGDFNVTIYDKMQRPQSYNKFHR